MIYNKIIVPTRVGTLKKRRRGQLKIRELLFTHTHTLYIYIYIYIYMCVCVCMCVLNDVTKPRSFFLPKNNIANDKCNRSYIDNSYVWAVFSFEARNNFFRSDSNHILEKISRQTRQFKCYKIQKIVHWYNFMHRWNYIYIYYTYTHEQCQSKVSGHHQKCLFLILKV